MTRTVSIGLALALCLAAALAGCRDNQESFYIEHMKVIPDPPECKYTTGDPAAYSVTVDLAFVDDNDFYAGFQVTNALMTREDYDNLKAESNGILVDGAEAAVSVGGQSAGASVFRAVDAFLEAESTDVIMGITIPGEVKTNLGAALGCASAEDTATAMLVDLQDGVLDNPPEAVNFDTGYGSVRFLGHTLGGSEVETNVFSFAIQSCCNCAVDWSACMNPCNAFCSEPTGYTYCDGALGINAGGNPLPCNLLTYNPNATWTSETDGGVVEVGCDSCGGD
jgi:hypothetical protein